jgi:hypothetical protein
MKKLTKTIVIAFAVSSLFSSCSKKMQAFQFGNTPAQTFHSNTNVLPDSKVSASIENVLETSIIENPAIIAAKTITSSRPATSESTISEVKPSFKQKLAQKIIVKKIQKLEKGKGKGGMSDKMKLGLVIALVSLLVLIIVAAGLLGGLSQLFWLLGGLGLLAGLLIMLLALLEVI